MLPLLSDEGLRRLDQIVQPGVLCMFDFDGTLSPIVPQAQQAWLPPHVKQRLIRLAQLATVAIVTGRALPDIRRRLQFEPHFVLGNHGIEGLPGWESSASRYRQTCAGWAQRLRTALQKPPYDPAIQIEDKQYSLSVHYRQAQDTRQTEALLSELFRNELAEARVIPGKCVFNLLPPGAENKGSAVEKLLQICAAQHAVYVGDDITDEDVFRLQRPGLLCVRIGKWAGSAAPFYLPDPESVTPFLQALIQRLQAGGKLALVNRQRKE